MAHIAGSQLEDAISAMLDQAIMPALASASSPDKASVPLCSIGRLLASDPLAMREQCNSVLPYTGVEACPALMEFLNPKP